MHRTKISPPAVELRQVTLAGTPVSYTLKRTRRRRSIGLHIDGKGLTVKVPAHASERWMLGVLQDKARWVLENLDRWQRSKPATEWRDGQPVPYVGATLILCVVASLFETPPMVRGKHLVVHVPDPADEASIEKGVALWYRQEAEILLRARVNLYAPGMGVAPSGIRLSSARTQWGSCTARGRVCLNWQLIKMPLRLIDYVVIHELAHLKELNHSPAFWQVVKTVCPDHAERRQELRKWSPAE